MQTLFRHHSDIIQISFRHYLDIIYTRKTMTTVSKWQQYNIQTSFRYHSDIIQTSSRHHVENKNNDNSIKMTIIQHSEIGQVDILFRQTKSENNSKMTTRPHPNVVQISFQTPCKHHPNIIQTSCECY